MNWAPIDYITKPFSPREVVARVKAVLRRSIPHQDEPQVIRSGDLIIDLSGHEVIYKGQRISLTATEFRILEFLAARPGRVFSRDEIIDAALGNETSVFDRTIDVHITAIRRKLGPGGEQIETVRGFGYKFRHAAMLPPFRPSSRLGLTTMGLPLAASRTKGPAAKESLQPSLRCEAASGP